MISVTTCLCLSYIFKMTSLLLMDAQEKLLRLFSDKFNIKIKLGEIQVFVNRIRRLLYTSDSMLKKPEKYMQQQTLVLAIYMYICRKLNQSMRLSNSLLEFGENLVFAGLYNLNYNSKEFDVIYPTFQEEMKSAQPEYIEITEMEIMFAIYGVDHKHIDKYNTQDTLLAHYTPFQFICNLINDIGMNEILVNQRKINIKSFISETLLFNEEDKCRILMEQVDNSCFLNIRTFTINETVHDFDYSTMKYINMDGCIIPIFQKFDMLLNFSKENLYGVVMRYDLFSDVLPKTTILTNELFEALEVASEFEYGIVFVYSHDFMPTETELDVSVYSFCERRYLPTNPWSVKETPSGKLDTHMVFSTPMASNYYYLTNCTYPKPMAILKPNPIYTKKKFNSV